MPKRRLDEALVERGLTPDARAAAGQILAGNVLVAGHRQDKPGTLVAADAEIRLKRPPGPFIGRGGSKLAHALDSFGIAVTGVVALDAGASTGGFTDCLLQRGAGRVYAVDAGYGQLAGRLRSDPRVVNRERTNLSDLSPGDLHPPPTLATLDLSYLSLLKAVPIAARLLVGDWRIVALVKPLFEEPDPAAVGDPGVHRAILTRLVTALDRDRFGVAGLTHSPILGSGGTVEFFIHLRPSPAPGSLAAALRAVPAVVDAGQEALAGGTAPAFRSVQASEE